MPNYVFWSLKINSKSLLNFFQIKLHISMFLGLSRFAYLFYNYFNRGLLAKMKIRRANNLVILTYSLTIVKMVTVLYPWILND